MCHNVHEVVLPPKYTPLNAFIVKSLPDSICIYSSADFQSDLNLYDLKEISATYLCISLVNNLQSDQKEADLTVRKMKMLVVFVILLHGKITFLSLISLIQTPFTKSCLSAHTYCRNYLSGEKEQQTALFLCVDVSGSVSVSSNGCVALCGLTSLHGMQVFQSNW